MSFYYPLGLLGLIGVPVLILIYIIKSKYTEQTIASTYLWELSEKFLKKRKPISKLTGIITLILQILAVIAASLLIAHPVFTIPASANDFYFVLDGSASMNMTVDGETRFDRAKSEISDIIDKSRSGSSYTLILAGDDTGVAFENVQDKDQAKVFLKALSAGWNSTDCSSAMVLVQDYFDGNPSAEVYLVTDKQYEETQNMNLLNVANGESNYAFTSYGYSKNPTTGEGTVISYTKDAEVTVEMWLSTTVGNPEKVAETKVELKAGENGAFKVQSNVTNFAALELRISSEDSFGEDNTVILYQENQKKQDRGVLLVDGSATDTSVSDLMYLKNALKSAGQADVTDIKGADYNPGKYSGYQLYVFNCFVPEALPQNAAVWLVNAVDGNGLPGSGITYRDVVEPRDQSGPNSYYTPSYNKDSKAKNFVGNLVQDRPVAVRKYAQYGVPKSFTKIMDINGDTAICAGLNENNDRQVVFAFKIGDSNFGMNENFLILVQNLVNYSIPLAVEKTNYDCGDVMNVNVVPGCEDIIITTPSGKSVVLDTNGVDTCEVQLNETGTYNVTVKAKGNESTTYVFSGVPEAESRPEEKGGSLILNGTKEFNYSDGYYDKLLAFFIVIAILLLADWGIYCYEQYQLR